jgi:hypothetical protein
MRNLKAVLIGGALAAGIIGIAYAATTTASLGTSGGPGGILQLFGSTSGSASIQPPAVAGSTTLTLPGSTDTLAGLAQTQTWTGPQTFGEVIGGIRSYSGTTDTLAATDCGLTVHSTGASAVTETVPNSLPAGCNIAIEAIGAGAVTASAGASATQHSPCTTVATNHQYAILWVHVESNAGSAAVYDVTGGCT